MTELADMTAEKASGVGGESAEARGSIKIEGGSGSGEASRMSIQLIDSSRSIASSGSDSTSGTSSASPSRPSSQLSTSRPSVKFASPRTLVMSFPSARSDTSADLSARMASGSNSQDTSALSSSRQLAASSSSSSGSAHFEHELALQRREFEHRFTHFQQSLSAEQLSADCTAYRHQVAAMSEQLAVQELFMACQRVELAHFYQLRHRDEQQRLWETQQAKERARLEAEQQEVQNDQLLSRLGSAVSAASSHSTTASELSDSPSAPSTASTRAKQSSRPATPPSAASSVSSVLAAAIGAQTSARPSAFPSAAASPYGRSSPYSLTSPASSRPTTAGLLSPSRSGSAAPSNLSAYTSPFASSAPRPISSFSPSPLSSRLLSTASSYPLRSSASSIVSPPYQSSPEPALSDVLALTESLLAQTDEALQAERAKSDALQTAMADMERRATATSRQYDADTAEIKEQLRIRAAVCSKQEEALHRLTFENHSLVQQIIQIQQQLQQQHSQQPTHPARPVQPSSHHLSAASHTSQSGSARHAVNMRDKSGGLFPPIPSASASASVTTGRLSKSRFVQPPPAAALSNGFSTDSSHASPISTAALGWSQGWKSYTSDGTLADERDESKEQLVAPGSNDKQLEHNTQAVARAPLLLFPTLQAYAAAIDDASDKAGDQSQHQDQQSAEVMDDGEVVVAASPRTSMPASNSAAPLPPRVADKSSVPDVTAHSSDASFTLSSSSPPNQVHTVSPALQPPPSPLSPDQLHLHAQFQRPPTSSAHDKQPPRIPSALRQRSTVTPTSQAASASLPADGLAVHASSFTKGPPAALRAAQWAAEGRLEEGGEQHESHETGRQLNAVAVDESEQGWVVEAGGASRLQ